MRDRALKPDPIIQTKELFYVTNDKIQTYILADHNSGNKGFTVQELAIIYTYLRVIYSSYE